MSAGEVTLTIDGVEVKTRPGNNILQAALDAGMYIPYLCYYPGMKSFGACRMCVVQAETRTPDGEYRPVPGTPASCTTPVAEGMRVVTNSERLVDVRRGLMEMLIAEHPHGCLTCHRIELCGPTDICLRHVSVNDRCVTCPKNERCELKDTVRYLEMPMETPLRYNYRHLPLKAADPFWEMDLNLCIVCARCVRVCDEVRGDYALTLDQRSGRTLIGTAHGASLLESGCEFCGACMDVCPTGTLMERKYKWDKPVKTVTTICPQCPVGCQIRLEVDRRNRVIRTVPDIDAPANHGQVCYRGKFGLDFVNRKERLRKPLVRRNGVLEEAAWSSALDLAAQRLAQYRGDQFALLASPRGTNEDSYIGQKFARVVMGTNNVDVSSNVRPELTAPLAEMLGHPAATNSIWELERSRCFLVVSSNVTEEQTVAAVPVKKANRQGATLIVIDQRETELTRYAKIWLRPRPGTEGALIGGMLRVILDESLGDNDFIAKSCDGLDALRNSLQAFDLVSVEGVTGVPQAQIQAAARLFATRKPGAILYALETVPPELRGDCVRSLVDLALVTGNLAKPSTGLYPLFVGANEQGAKDVGCSPAHLPGYSPVSDAAARQRVQQAWSAEVPSSSGLSLRQMGDAIRERRIKAALIIGDSPSFKDGELGDFMKAIKGLEFLVVQDTFASELKELAHVVLPSATFAEKQGTYTNLERRVQLLRPALGPRGDEDEDWRILCQIARRMGAQGFDYQNAQEVFDELKGLVDIYKGMSYERLQPRGLQWPCVAADAPDTPILYAGGLEKARARLIPLHLSEAPAHNNEAYPLVLARGRILHDPDREVEIVKTDGRNAIKRDEIIEIHPEDAQNLGISEGDWVEAVYADGRLRGIAQLSGPQRGLISATGLFGQLIAELERSKDPDPMFKVPGLPLAPARIEKVSVAAAAD
jgi:formate dehydrogenase alpha subunit